MKELPKVFANTIDKEIHNNKEYNISKSENKISDKKPVNINKKINDIFSSYKYVYKADVIITTSEGEMTKNIIGKKDNNLITMDNELIDISTILDIKFKE